MPAFKAMYIARPDQALRLILKPIVTGDQWGYCTIADIGRAELIEDMGVSAKRIPPWLLPESCLARAKITPADRGRVRPDILLVNMTQSGCMRYRRPAGRHTDLSTNSEQPKLVGCWWPIKAKVWLIEGGYTSDTRHLEKLAEKKNQHQKLMDALVVRGFDA